MVDVQGEVAPGFESVREAFTQNFEQHGDVGAAFALYVRGTKVVDLWGGVADQDDGRPWTEDTLQLVFSTTKGATAMCAHLLASRGELDLDAPVQEYWPEFATEGKDAVPVRWLLCHKAGLPVVDEAVTPAQAVDWDHMAGLLAAGKPQWEPGTAHGYHALTYGWLVGEVVRRVSGRSLGRFLADELAGPLGLDLWVGLPEGEEKRVSRLIEQSTDLGEGMTEELVASLPEEVRALVTAYLDPTSLTQRALTVTDPALDWNSREVHAAEIPAANGIADARSLARLYAACVGEVDGVRVLDEATVRAASEVQTEGQDRVLLVPTVFGSGFMLSSDFAPLLSDRSFGHPGAGGSLAFGDPDAQVGFAYVMNKMQQNLAGDPRTLTLIEAVRTSL
ncbi:MAG: beta-lactamase family protein [Acidimicrobiia bacterium]|nr:beta-lactamase family protein [Acidimicrobiia bacterium]